MHIDKEAISKDTNYCSICWQEFTTLTEQEFENLKDIHEEARKRINARRRIRQYNFPKYRNEDLFLYDDKGHKRLF